jgi:hypothetical protein
MNGLAPRLCFMVAVGCSAIVGSGASRAVAQEAAVASRPDARHIPFDAIAFLSVQPQQLLQSEMATSMPRESAVVAAREQFGIDLNSVQRIDMVLGMPTPAGVPFGALVTLDKPFAVEGLSEQVLASRELESFGKVKGYPLRFQPNMILVVLDANRVLVGMADYVERMATRVGTGGQLQQLVPKLSSWSDLQLLIALDDVRSILTGGVEGLQGKVTPQLLDDLRRLVSDVDHVSLSADIHQQADFRLALVSEASDGGPALAESWNRAMASGREMMLRALDQQSPNDMSPAMAAALKADMTRITGIYVKQYALEGAGDRAEIRGGRTDLATTGVLIGLLLPAVQSARESARQMQAMNNLKQIGLAMHSYAAEHDGLPPAAIVDDEGNPLLSWRVSLLPYLEQKPLYDQFHLDEPWDSEHNLALVERMPAIYKHPSTVVAPGQTVFAAIVGEQAGLRFDQPRSFEDFGNAISNRILVAQVPDFEARYWTAPEDLNAQTEDDMANLEVTTSLMSHPSGRFLALFADGSVRRLDMGFEAEQLQGMLLQELDTSDAMADDTPDEDEDEEEDGDDDDR